MKADKSATIGKSRNLVSTLVLAFLTLSITILLLLGVVGLFFLVQTQQETVKNRQQLVARWASGAVSGFIQEKFRVLETAIRLSRSEREYQGAMQNLLGMEPAFRQLMLLDESNEERYRVTRMSKTESARLDRQLADDPFGAMAAKERHISSVYMDQVTGEPLVQLTVPVTTVLGERQGLLVAEVNLKFIWQLVEELQIGESGYAYVVDRRGMLLAYGDTGRVLRNEKLDHLRDVADFISGADRQMQPTVHAARGITGKQVLGTYVPLGEPDWAVMIELPIQEAYRPVMRTVLIFVVLILTVSALAGLLGHFLARRLAAPIVALTRTASTITDGALDTMAKVGGPTEVQQLSVAFNKMTRELRLMLERKAEKSRVLEREIAERRQLESTLQDNEERLKDLLLNVPGVVYQYTTDPDSPLTSKLTTVVGGKMFEVFGLETDEDNVVQDFVAHLPEEDIARFSKSVEDAVAMEKSWYYEGEFIKSSGEKIWFEGRSEPKKVNGVLMHYGLLSDVTERKEMEASLQLAKFIFDRAAIGIYQVDLNGGIMNVNPHAAELLGYTQEEMANMHIWDIDDNIPANAYEDGHAKLSGGKDVFETKHTHKDGSHLYVEVISEILEYQGQQTRFAFVRDNTESKRIKEELQAKDILLHDMGRLARVGGWKFDVETGKAINTDEVARIHDIDSSEAVDIKESLNCYSGESRVAIEQAFRELLENGVPYDLELELISVKGVHKWVRTLGQPVIKDGRVIQALGSIQDITERKLAEEALREGEARLKNLTANVPEVVIQFRVTEDNVFSNEFLNPKITEIFGIEQNSETVLEQFYTCIPDTEKQAYSASMQQAIDSVSPWNYEGRFKKPDGTIIWFSGHALPQVEENSIVFYGVLQDITERKKMESALRLTQFIYDKAPIGIWRMGEKGEIIDVNEQGYSSLGYTREELCQMKVFDLDPNFDLERWEGNLSDLEEAGVTVIETLHRRKSGEIFPIQVIQNLVRYENQVFHVAFVQDISERKKMEQDLRESQEQLELALEGANEGIWDLNLKDGSAYLDARGYAIAGYEVNEFPGTLEEIFNRIHEEDSDYVRSNFRQYMAGELEHYEVQFRFLCKDGTYMWVLSKGNIVSRDEDGSPIRFVGTNADITHLKETEKALRVNERLLNNILESMNEGLLVLDREFRHTHFNSAMEKISSTSKKSVIGKRPWEVFPVLKGTDVEAYQRRAMAGETPEALEFSYRNQEGALVWNRDSFSPIKDDMGEVIGVVCVVSDISRQKQDEKELRSLRNYLSNIIDSMPSILVAVDGKGRVTQWNSRTAQVTGISFEEAQSRPLNTVYPRLADKMDEIETAIRERRVISDPKISHTTDGDNRFEDITIFPLVANGVEGAVIRLDDVTEHVRMEEMIIQSEKMLTVGGLAAGMAHEINNPLAGILQTAEVMTNRLSNNLDTPANLRAAEDAGITLEGISQFMQARGIFRMINTINSSGRRVADIVSNMLSFARKSNEGAQFYHIDQILDNTFELAATDYDLKKDYDFKKITIIREYGENVPPIMCERSKIQQVLLNIVGNGAQAMKESGIEDPRLIVRTYFDQDREMVCMEIEDNGPGMDESTRKKVFDPFFTTKNTGKGTGLGMSVSYFIITENHGGEMAVTSEPGSGATFIIRLPVNG